MMTEVRITVHTAYGGQNSQFEFPVNDDGQLQVEIDPGTHCQSVYDALYCAIPKEHQIRYAMNLMTETLMFVEGFKMEAASYRRDLNSLISKVKVSETNSNEAFDVLRARVGGVEDDVESGKDDDNGLNVVKRELAELQDKFDYEMHRLEELNAIRDERALEVHCFGEQIEKLDAQRKSEHNSLRNELGDSLLHETDAVQGQINDELHRLEKRIMEMQVQFERGLTKVAKEIDVRASDLESEVAARWRQEVCDE
jgi:ABC-type phosphate transport system auxiliary subunit